MGLRIIKWNSIDGYIPIQEWLNLCNIDDSKTTTSMIACLQVNGMKCHLVKDLKKDGLHEIRRKLEQIRVYFFEDKEICSAIVTGAGFKDTQKEDIELSYERMKEYERRKENSK